MISHEAVEAAVEAFLKDDKSYCECRHSTLDKHDVNPPCSTRKRVAEQMASVLEAAAPSTASAAWDEGFQDGLRQDSEGEDGPRFTNPYRSQP